MDLSDEKLFTALAKAAKWRVSEFNAQDFANTAWPLAMDVLRSVQASKTATKEAVRHMSHFSPQLIANTAF